MKFLRSAVCVVLVCCGVCRSYGQTAPVSPLNKADSIPGSVKKQFAAKEAQLKKLVPGDSMALKQAQQAGQQLQQTGQQLQHAGKQQIDSALGILKSPLAQLQQPLKIFEGQKAVTVNQLSVDGEYTYFRDTAGLGLGMFNGMMGTTGYSVNYGVTLGGLPFTASIREANGINTLNYTPFQNFYQFNFNQQQYLQNLRNQLLSKLSPEALMNSALNRVNVIRNNYETELKGEVTSMQQEYTKSYKSTLTLPPGATNLSASDMAALRIQMMPGDSVQKYQKEMARLQEMTSKNQGQPPVKDSSYQATLAGTKRFETTEKIYNRITAYRKKFQDNPVVKQLLTTSSFTPGAMKAYLTDPRNLSQVLDDQASMSVVQRLFVNIKQLDLGQNAVQSGELNMQNVVNTGVNTEFQNKSTTVGMIYGQNNNVNNWQQAGLTSQVTNEYSNVTGFKLGTGMGSGVDQSITFDMFRLNNSGSLGQGGAAYLPVAPHQDGAISLHTGFQFSPQHQVTLDLSKSFGSYQQTNGPDTSGAGKLPPGSVFNGAGRSNYAGILNYTGELFRTDLKVYIKKVGLGYYNPGNFLLHSGETEVGLGLARKFMNRRLTIKYDGDYRRQVYDPYGNYEYSAFSNKFQAGYKIDRNDKVNLTYQRSDYRSVFYQQAPVFGVNSRLQLDAAYRLVIDGKKVMNNTTISSQETEIPLSTGGNYIDHSVLVTSTSTFTSGKNPLSLTVLYNHSDNNSYYFNTSMFSAEANYPYTLPGWPRMSSGIGYYDNQAWNQQVGIRQQVSAMIRQKISLDFQLSYRKAIRTIQTALANQLFINTTMHYQFK
jgi:hypothetical protein